MMISSAPTNPLAFQSSMVFIDGTNFIYRLQDHGLRWKPGGFENLATYLTGPRKNLRTYFYTNPHKLEEFKKKHGASAVPGCRVVLGDGVVLADGNVKEKGVDALLVADLIYHAATRNVHHVAIVTHDTDFAYAIKRVEDFGVTTSVAAFLVEPSERLRNSADKVIILKEDDLIANNWAERVSS